ncbi:MAG TPA: glycosyltransferase [Allosphingosinicella sp.]|jgi:glycosyltransferase involved in cell wall biosynthesis
MLDVLYLTQDGITDHIGQAQISPYLIGLARRGYRIHIVSAEKAGREAACARSRAVFDAVGIQWTTVPYANRPPIVSSFWTMYSLWRAAARVARADRPRLIHCRSYLPLEIAARLKRVYGGKYLVDFRDFWADVGIETKPFKSIYRAFRRREARALEGADHVVTLTSRAADVLIGRHPQLVGGSRAGYTVIPCCADFDLFDPASVPTEAAQQRRRELALKQDTTVLLYLGSVGADYLLPEMMAVFVELRRLRPESVFLFLINNGHDVVAEAARSAGLKPEDYRLVSAAREDIPQYLAVADLSCVFIRPTLSKSGCSPTKLGELFAMNVPIIANAGVGDLDEIVDIDRNGSLIVADFAPETLRSALSRLLAVSDAQRAGIRARNENFSLESGVRKYADVYAGLIGAPAGRTETAPC